MSSNYDCIKTNDTIIKPKYEKNYPRICHGNDIDDNIVPQRCRKDR